MKSLLHTVVLTAIITGGALGYPADLNEPLPQESIDAVASSSSQEKQVKQSLFGTAIDINLSKNGSIFPLPASLVFNTSYLADLGGDASLVFPAIFPFNFFVPPFNLTLSANAESDFQIYLNASAGNQTANSSLSGGAGVNIGVGGQAKNQEIRGSVPLGKPFASVSGEMPRPNLLSKPTVSVADAMQAANTLAEHQTGNMAFENTAVESVVLSSSTNNEVDSAESAPSAQQPLSGMQVVPVVAVPVLIEGDANPVMAIIPVAESSPMASDVGLSEVPGNDLKSRVSALLSSTSGKSRRHAGVESPSALRIEDFEDVEVQSELTAPETPATQEENVNHQVSAEEMILLAMEQAQQMAPSIQLSVARPAPLGPGGLVNTNPLTVVPNKPLGHANPDNSGGFRNEESSLVQVPTKVESGKHKPRPYGMDHAKSKPSRPRPTLDSGMKERDQHFGLPHSSDVHKGQVEAEGSSVLGWQIPSIKWPSFTNIFQNFLGNRHKATMGKSDAEVKEASCQDDEESEMVRSPTIQGGHLCPTSGVQSQCNELCVSKGFSAGNCLGPGPTPGCLCRMPANKEFGLMLSPLDKETSENQDVKTSLKHQCKRCACSDACKRSGSYMGFCADSCMCATPWYLKQN